MEKAMPRGTRHAWTFHALTLLLTWVLAALVPAPFLVVSPAFAQSVEQFYKGRRLTMLVGSAVGGGYDAYARAVSRHLGRFIPGNPTFVVQNMPGAAGAGAA